MEVSLIFLLNQNSHFRIIIAKFLGRIALSFFEDAIEIGQIIESTIVAYFGNGFARIDQIARSNAQA